MHRDQLDIDVERARMLIHAQFPQFRDEKIVALSAAGTVNAIFRIGTSHAARFPLRRMDAGDCARELEAEAHSSAEFARHSPVPSPQPVGMGHPGAGYPMPWQVQTWVEGETAAPNGLAVSARLAVDLAHLINALRKADLKGRSFKGSGRGGNLADHDGWMAECFDKSEDLLEVPRLRDLWTRFRNLPHPGYEVMSHKDLIPANLLVSGDRLCGILYTGGFGPADPALDLVCGWHLLDRSRRKFLREGLDCSDLEWQCGAAWAFQQAMGLVWYYKDTNPVMHDLGKSTIGRLLEDADTLGLA